MIRYSEYFNVSSEDLKKRDVINVFVDEDTSLHVDPTLLDGSMIPEFKNAHQQFLNFFTDFLCVVRQIKYPGDRFYKEAVRRMKFKEISFNGLGYGKSNKGGNAVGGKLSTAIVHTAIDLINAGKDNPRIFLLMPFFEEGVGADRISDMTIFILRESFYMYTARVAKELNLETKSVVLDQKEYELPYFDNEPIMFIPMTLATDLPTASCYGDVDEVCEYNSVLRAKVSEIIGIEAQDQKNITKSKLKDYIVSNSDVYEELITTVDGYSFLSYDEAKDRLNFELIDKVLSFIANKYHEKGSVIGGVEFDNFYTCVEYMIDECITLIEENRIGDTLLYDGDKFKNEKTVQALLTACLSPYCKSYDISLDREVNNGPGALDFKLSQGEVHKVCIEIKLASNPNLLHGYTEQLSAYNRAENLEPNNSYYIVVKGDDRNQKMLTELEFVYQQALQNGNAPKLLIIDARKKPSASKRK